MSKKNKVSVLVFAVAILAAILWSRGSSPVTQSAPVSAAIGSTAGSVTQALPEFDFGSVSMRKGDVAHDFVLLNDSGKDLRLKQAATSCMCTNAFVLIDGAELGPFGMPGHGFIPPVERTVPAGGKFTVRAVFDPAAHGPAGIGRIGRQIVLETDQGRKTFSFRANVTP